MQGLEGVIERMRETGKSMARSSFVPAETLEQLPTIDRARADQLPFGLVKVDDEGKIQLYNKYESQLSGLAPGDVEGKNFFTQVAPCTNNDIFYGSFRKGVRENDLNMLFLYTFTYKMAPTNVKVHLYRHPSSGENFVLVQRR